MKSSQEINELSAALAKAQAQIKGAEQNNYNPHFKSTYSDLSAVWEVVRGPLSSNGLSVIQTVIPRTNEAGASTFVTLETTLAHSSGQWVSSEVPLITQRNDMQGLGSAITYARRYGLMAIVGVAEADDDGEGSVKRPQGAQSQSDAPNPSPAQQNAPKTNPRTPGGVTEAQMKRLHAIKAKAGVNDAVLKDMAKEIGIESSQTMTRDQYDTLCARLEEIAKRAAQ